MALRADALLDTRDAFDRVASSYDASNTANPLLQAMRCRAIASLCREVLPGSQVLELGCGPGTDSVVLMRAGLRVTAIDWSPSMVKEATARLASADVHERLLIRQLGIHELDQLSPSVFDAAFSNFGPLNCVPDLADAARQIGSRLRSGGVLVASVVGRVCPWELALYFSRGDRRRATIRFSSGFVPVPLAGGTVWTRYYTPTEFQRPFEAAGFRRVRLRALGLFAPPPYLEALAGRHPRVNTALQWLDDRTGTWPGFRQFGDHFLITLRKN